MDAAFTVTIPATTVPFVAREKFVVGNAQVRITLLSYNFRRWFSDKIEKPAPETILRYTELVESSVDDLILADLGGKTETTLAEIYTLMERQKNGEEGVLLTSGWMNIFFVYDVNDELRAVGVRWRGDGWGVYVSSVTRPRGWSDVGRVFSQDS